MRLRLQRQHHHVFHRQADGLPVLPELLRPEGPTADWFVPCARFHAVGQICCQNFKVATARRSHPAFTSICLLNMHCRNSNLNSHLLGSTPFENVNKLWYNEEISPSVCADDNQPYLSVPCSEHKITSAVWGPLGEFVNAGHENGEINQFSAKVVNTVCLEKICSQLWSCATGCRA